MVAIPSAGSQPNKQLPSLTTLQLMKLARRWLVWKYGVIPAPGKKAPKQPFYVNGEPRSGETDTAEDYSQLASYEVAKERVRKGGGTWHLGFALGPDGGGGHWQGHDNDVDPQALGATAMPGYTERSVSGQGWHAIGYGRPFASKNDHANGLEWYSSGRYFAVTEEVIKDGPPADLYDLAGTGPPPDRIALSERPVETLEETQLRDIRNALRHLDPDPYGTWVAVALALQKVEGGEEIFLEWARRSGKFDEKENRRKFANTGLPYAPWRSIFVWAKEAGWDPKEVPGFDLLERAVPVDFGTPRPIEFVLDGFVATGTVVVAGAPGVGKSSVLMGMAMSVAHLAALPGLEEPYLRRRVYFITEDPDQVRRIVRGAHLRKAIKVGQEEFDTWFKLIPSSRARPEAWRKSLAALMKAEEVDPYQAGAAYKTTPLIVFDTVPSNLELEDENSNAAASEAIAAIRAGAGTASVWAVTHTAKAQKFADPEEMSARGAGAWAGDTQGEIFIAFPPKEDPDDPPPEKRWLQLGKRRFEPVHVLYEVETEVTHEEVPTPWGQRQEVLYRTVSAFAPKTLAEKAEAKSKGRNDRREMDEQAQLMVAVGRFKKALAACEGRGFAISHARGAQPPLPEGWVKAGWDDFVKGIGGKGGGLRARLVDAALAGFKPEDTGSYYLFAKPAFGMGAPPGDATVQVPPRPEA